MPFKSSSQQRWMFANKPEMAKRWASETSNIKKLPNKVNQMSKKSILKKYTGKGGMKAEDFQQMQRQDDQKTRVDMGKAPSPFKVVGNALSSGLKGIKNLGGKVISSYASGFKAVDAAREARDNKMKIENWGSPGNYDKLQDMPLLKKKLGKK